MDYRHSTYGRAGPYDAAPQEDAYERNRKRNRSQSPQLYGGEQRAYAEYPPLSAVDPWDRPRDYNRPAYEAYDDRAAEWDRYYREQDQRNSGFEYPDRERYESRPRYDDEYPNGEAASARRASREGRYPADFRRKPAEPMAAPDPMQSDSLVPFRAYAQMTKAAHPSARDRTVEPLSSQELYDSYQTYKTAYNKKVVANFFEQRKGEEWFKEKYSNEQPYLDARQKRRRLGRAGKKEAWLSELQQGKLDNINFDMQPLGGADESHGRRGSDSQDESRFRDSSANDAAVISRYGEREVLTGELAAVPACEHQILIKNYPADGSRERLEALLQTKPGFQYLAMGEPHVAKRWCRAGWAMYAPGTDIDEILSTLQGSEVDGCALNLASCAKSATSKLRTVPEYANSFARLTTDLKQAQQLVARFEAEDRDVLFADQPDAAWLETSGSDAIMDRHRQLEADLLEEDLERGFDDSESPQRREQRRGWLKKHLDLHLDLLRSAYNCDYYISLVCEFAEEMLRRSPCHARRQPAGSVVEEPRDASNDESWARSVDQKTALLLATDATDLTEHGGKSVDAELMAAALGYVKQEEAEKHRCTVEVSRPDGTSGQCGKLFKAVNFVQKHVLNKHRAVLLAQPGMQLKLDDVAYFNNYMRDAGRATAQPAATGNGAPPPAAVPFAGRMGSIRFGGPASSAGPPLGMRLGAVVPDANGGLPPPPLPPAPKPLDPRASRPSAHYQDLDTAAEGDVELVY